MMVMAPYPGFDGNYFSMPCRNVVPKPLQKPHPPVWVACSNRETIKLAAQLGIGALTFAFVDPTEAKQWVDDFYRIIKTECVPIGHSVNANIAMVTGFSVHPDAEEAKRRGEDGFKFFGYALAHHYIFGEHTPGRTDIWAAYEKVRTSLPEAGAARGIGTPEQLRAHLKSFEDAGVDQVAFIQQGGKNRHDHICQSLELFAREVLPEFDEREEARARRKQQELTPFLEQAMMRKEKMAPLAEDRIPSFVALGRQVAETEQLTPEQAAARRRMLAAAHVPLEDPGKALAAD
jgi:alkanesulfonate monooxygenase SsuD/methylene tetrahydromethanopterin reductase-like flavin-dependent oxidoreductase (luciferase family)